MGMFNLLFQILRRLPGFNVLLRAIYHCDIPRRTKIVGKGVRFGHNGSGIVIHPNTVIEENVFIQHHVT